MTYTPELQEFAQQHGILLIPGVEASLDAHFRWQIHTTYSMINGEKTIPGVIQAIKEGKITIVSKPLSLLSIGGAWAYGCPSF